MKTLRAVALVLGFVFAWGCAALGVDAPKVPVPAPVDVARVARESRLASVKACKTYQAAIVAGWIKPDDRADAACALVQNVCSDSFVPSLADVADAGATEPGPAPAP